MNPTQEKNVNLNNYLIITKVFNKDPGILTSMCFEDRDVSFHSKMRFYPLIIDRLVVD